jgi:uncharacterized protein YdaL
MVLALGSGDGLSGVLSRTIGALWFAAGAAMLVFTAFLVVLVIAALIFRLGSPNRPRNSTAVFSFSSVVVVVSASLLLATDSFRDEDAGETRPVARVVNAAATPPPARIYPAQSELPLRLAKGGSSGAAVFDSKTRALILWGVDGPDGTNAELDATKLVNLVSHFGRWTAHPVRTYRSGEMTPYDAVIYLGTADGAALPAAFRHDVAKTRHPVMWINGDIGQLDTGRYGFTATASDTGPFTRLAYRGGSVRINQVAPAGLNRIEISDPAKVAVLGEAIREDGATVPWAVRSGDFTYVAEDPLPYISHDNDRYLAFADLLFDVLAPHTPERHRALVRLEDVGPTADPAQLRAVVDYLSGQGVPFSIGVYPVYRDPVGADGDVTVRLSERPELVATLKYATAHGGTVLMHGYTHQYGTVRNPVNGRSGDDAEFYLVRLDEQRHQFLPEGPVTEDSTDWALDRIDRGLAEFSAAGLPKPSMFEFPHYMASPVDYVAAGRRFDQRYERSLYFPGLLSGGSIDDSGRGWQFFPYPVRDVYGAVVLPENLDYVPSTGDAVPQMLEEARANLVVRDGVASFFYHPFLGVGKLPELVNGIRAAGYTFVSAADLAASP